jgi:crotonobetainyl-CoA:carnitine CoA-transferase CaiB-like acyl-CoA transferase
MKPLLNHRVLALTEAARSPLCRYLSSLGAVVVEVPLAGIEAQLRDASFFIEQAGLAPLAAGGLSRDRIEAINPRLIHVSVTPFGSVGPRQAWRGSELIASAMGGPLNLTGDPDRSPVKEAYDACGFHADMVAAAGALAAHWARLTHGLGQHVDVSVQEVAFSRCTNSILVWQFDRRKLHRVGGALNYGLATVRCIWPLKDGWCFHTLMTGRFGAPANAALSEWMEAAGADNPLRGVDWLKYNRATLDRQVRQVWETAIEAFFRTRTKSEIAGEGRRRGINATVIGEPADALHDAHLAERRFWSVHDGLKVPGRFLSFSEGTQAAEVAPHAVPRVLGGCLAGIRVLDFSWALVGSITTKTLGDLGAEVIKVESRTRPCLSRLDVQVSASKPGNFDDKPWFAHLNSSKKSLALDMKRPESREVLEPLIRWADVVVENFSPGTMTKLGLDYASLCRYRPDIIMVSGSVYGQSGPLSQEWGVDGTGAALSGRTFLTGWPDRDPVIPGAVPFGDVIVPYVMAAGTAAALAHRRASGRGCHIDASMYEICVQQMHDAMVDTQRQGRPQRQGNTDAHYFHQGVYPTAGHDRWIAISCATAEEWERLLSFAGLPHGQMPAASTLPLQQWSSGQSGPELMRGLQAAGIRAGVVQDIEDLIEHDPQLAARGSLTMLEHPLLGPFAHMRTPLSLSRNPVALTPAPKLGEHSHLVARELSGLTESRVLALEQAGVFQ